MDKTVRGQITIVDYKDGEDAYAVFADHDSHAVSCDPSGNPLAGELGASGKAVFLFSASRGAANLAMRYASAAGSSGVCAWTIKRAVGCTAAVVSGSNDKMSINTLTADSGYVEVSFNLEGKQTLDKRLVVVKQKKGDQGAQGKPGADGKPGTDGKQGCMLRPRGAWVAQTAYVYDAQYRDVVMVDGSWYIVRTSHTSGTQFDLSKWEEFNEFINLATSVLLAGKGYIDVMGAGRLMVYDTDKSTGWEMTAGMIRHTKTGLTLTADGKLYDPDGVHISAGGQTIKQMQNGLAGVATRVSSAEAELKVQSGLIATKVSETDFNGNTIASKINQSATTIQIEASKINLKGAVTFESMSSNMQDKVNSAVVKSEVQYALGDSSTVAPVSGWNVTSPVWTEGKYVWQRTAATTGTGTAYSQAVCIQGAKGSKGDQGIQGPAGKDGRTTYFHIKYSMKSAPTSAADMTETPSDYIGTYVDYTEADSTDPKKYTWSRFKGLQGATGTQGIPGKNGADGRTSYLHIKYSNDGKTFTANNGEDAGNWIGQYTDFTQADSMEFAKYKWSKIKGETGPTGSQGIPGTSSYFHVKYSPNANGNPMSDTPNIYIGTAVTTTSSAPTSYTAYKWSQFKGSKGDQGIQGPAGKDGRTTYFHIKYSMKSAPTSAADMTETPSDYIGTYVDYTEADSTDPKKYIWSRFKGLQGATGTQGIPGKNGADGRTSYLHIKYSNDGKTFTANNGEDAGNWIGQYTDFTQADSMEFAKYKWSKIKGETGPTGSQGIPGTSSYFHVKYSPNANGNPMSDTPNIYIGTAVTTTSSAPTSYTAYKWSQFKGSKGDQGIQGPAGKDGRTTYFHIKYSMKSAPTSAADMTETPSDYIGTYVDYTEADSTDPKKYIWSRFKGLQGATGTQGIPGKNGADGRTSYLHIKYSNDGKTFTANNGEDAGNWIGQYTDFTQADSMEFAKYKWSKIKGETGPTGSQGIPGTSSYFHVKYSPNANGNPMSDTPNIYIGTAVTTTSSAPTSYTAYKWSQFKGSKGDQGIQGPAGKDGRTTYFHIKYSMKSAPTSAADMTETPSDYIGTYVDYTEADSTDPKKYTWSRFKGIQGATGTQGIPGKNGADGRTSYLHIKYSNDGKTFTANNGEDAGNWIGQYTDFTQADSMEFAKYKWSKIKGETGPTGSQGIPGTSSYFHVKYSPNANGNPMSDTPNIYIGTAVTTTSSAPTSYTAYKWSQFKGSKGDQGIQGPAGKDGRTTYFHIKYSMKSAPTSAADMTETPSDYIGTYVDYTEADSTDPKKYTWSRFKGIQGATGTQGVGVKAQELQYYLSTSSTTVTGGSWVSSPPAWAVGKYLWERTKVTWTNGSVSYTNAVFNKFVSDPIELARLGKTVVDGGYIKTSLINVNSLLSQNITVSNNAVITNLRAKNAVIEGMLKGVIGTFKSLSTEDGGISVSPTEFNVRDCDVSILGSVNGRNVRLSSYDIWCDDFLGFMALNYRIFNIPRAGDAYIHVSGSKGVIENMWEICGEDREPINLVYLRGNGTYRLNVCEAPIGHVIIVCNDSSNNKDIALARTPDHPYITLQSYRSVVLVANGQNNYYNSRYVSTLLPIVGFGY